MSNYGPITTKLKFVLDAVHKASRYGRKFRIKPDELTALIEQVHKLEGPVKEDKPVVSPALPKEKLVKPGKIASVTKK